MMNMFKLSEQLKDFSKDQLVREMKMPSGSVPQFLVLTELQRRTRMEREAQGGDAPEQSTVAQDAVAVTQPNADDLEEMELLLLSRQEVEEALTAGEFKVLPWSATVALVLLQLGTAKT